MEPLYTTGGGDWLRERVGGWGLVGGVAGTGFEAYARILHPIDARHTGGESARWGWADVARRNGRTMHPLVQWFSLTDDEQLLDFDDGWGVDQSTDGQLAADLLAALTAHLKEATGSFDDITAAFWHGWGELHPDSGSVLVMFSSDMPLAEQERERRRIEEEHRKERLDAVAPAVRELLEEGPVFAWPGREYLLMATTLDELADQSWPERAGISGLMPQMLWPADRTWSVASEIDWDSTIVAGSRSLIDAVLADERFESFEVHESSDLTWDGDTINPHPQGRMDT